MCCIVKIRFKSMLGSVLMKFLSASSAVLLPAYLYSFCEANSTSANGFDNVSQDLTINNGYNSSKKSPSKYRGTQLLVTIEIIVILMLCCKFLPKEEILRLFSFIKEKIVAYNEKSQEKNNISKLGCCSTYKTEASFRTFLFTKEEKGTITELSRKMMHTDQKLKDVSSDSTEEKISSSKKYQEATDNNILNNKNNVKKETAGDIIKSFSPENFDIVDLAKIEKYKNGILKAIYSYFFLSDCENNLFFMNDKKCLKERFLKYLEKLKKDKNISFSDYSPDDSKENLIEHIDYLVSNIKKKNPELKKLMAGFLLENIDDLGKHAQNNIKSMYFGKIKHKSDYFVKENEEFSPQSLGFRGLNVEEKVRMPDVLMQMRLDNKWFEQIIKDIFFDKKNCTKILYALKDCEKELIVDSIEFIEKLKSEKKVTFGNKVFINDRDDKTKLLNMFRAIALSKTSDDVKETIAEFLFEKRSLLGQKGVNYIYKQYKLAKNNKKEFFNQMTYVIDKLKAM